MREPVEVAPGVFRLEQADGAKRVTQHVVVGRHVLLCVDTGLPSSPAEGLTSLLEALGGQTRRLIVVLSHPDADHVGGTAAIVEHFPHAVVCTGAADSVIGDVEATLRDRYLAYREDGFGLSDAQIARTRKRLGGPFAVDLRFASEAELELGNRVVRILELPGHSAGHLGVWVTDERIAIVADAVMGEGVPRLDGSLLYAPMFAPPAVYLRTIERLSALAPRLLLTCHFSVDVGDDPHGFLDASERAYSKLAEIAADAPRTSLADACAHVRERYGGLDPDAASSLAPTVAGFLAWEPLTDWPASNQRSPK